LGRFAPGSGLVGSASTVIEDDSHPITIRPARLDGEVELPEHQHRWLGFGTEHRGHGLGTTQWCATTEHHAHHAHHAAGSATVSCFLLAHDPARRSPLALRCDSLVWLHSLLERDELFDMHSPQGTFLQEG